METKQVKQSSLPVEPRVVGLTIVGVCKNGWVAVADLVGVAVVGSNFTGVTSLWFASLTDTYC